MDHNDEDSQHAEIDRERRVDLSDTSLSLSLSFSISHNYYKDQIHRGTPWYHKTRRPTFRFFGSGQKCVQNVFQGTGHWPARHPAEVRTTHSASCSTTGGEIFEHRQRFGAGRPQIWITTTRTLNMRRSTENAGSTYQIHLSLSLSPSPSRIIIIKIRYIGVPHGTTRRDGRHSDFLDPAKNVFKMSSKEPGTGQHGTPRKCAPVATRSARFCRGHKFSGDQM